MSALGAVATVMLIAAGSTACDSGPDRLSAEAFTEQANAACAAANEDIDGMLSVSLADPVAAADRLDDVTARQRALGNQLGELHPPSELQDTYDELLVAARDALDANDAIAEAMRSGDTDARGEANVTAMESTARADTAATELDLTDCTAPPPG